MTYASRLTSDEIASTRSRHPIVDVLERAGVQPPGRLSRSADFMMSCPRPEHADSTPSCAVHPATGTFYCFGCGARGDVFALVSELTGITSLARIAELLDSGGRITLAADVSSARVSAMSHNTSVERPTLDRTPIERVLEVNEEAWQFLASPRLADRGRLYLARRGLDVWGLESELGRPLVGHTPADRDALSRHLGRRGFSSDEIVDAGWALRRFDRLTDRFHDRTLFPIRDGALQVLGVIGRDVTGRAGQKYLNTARTVAFCKGSLLYRPMPAIDIDPTVIISEGPLDALAIAAASAQSGRASQVVAVAPSGTALTADQARQVLAISPRLPIICTDGDDPGISASARWAETFRSAGRDTRVVRLPSGQDPASWLADRGTDGLATLLHTVSPPALREARQLLQSRPDIDPPTSANPSVSL